MDFAGFVACFDDKAVSGAVIFGVHEVLRRDAEGFKVKSSPKDTAFGIVINNGFTAAVRNGFSVADKLVFAVAINVGYAVPYFSAVAFGNDGTVFGESATLFGKLCMH